MRASMYIGVYTSMFVCICERDCVCTTVECGIVTIDLINMGG